MESLCVWEFLLDTSDAHGVTTRPARRWSRLNACQTTDARDATPIFGLELSYSRVRALAVMAIDDFIQEPLVAAPCG